MNCTLQLFLWTRNPKVLTLKIKFSLSSCFRPLFWREIYFSWQWPWTRVYVFMAGSHGVVMAFLKQSLASREVWIGIDAFWLNIFNLRESLYSWKVFLGYIWAVDLVLERAVLRFAVKAKRMAQSMAGTPPKRPFESWGISLSTLQRVCVGTAWISHRRDPTVVSTQLFPSLGQSESPCLEYLWEGSSAT